MEKAPEKTYIAKIEKGFDFLGYHFSPEGLTVAQQTIERFVVRVTRLYEQGRAECRPSHGPLIDSVELTLYSIALRYLF